MKINADFYFPLKQPSQVSILSIHSKFHFNKQSIYYQITNDENYSVKLTINERLIVPQHDQVPC